MAKHLLDSDILIWVLRGKKEAVELLNELLKDEIPVISSLAFYEIWVGARPAEEEMITKFLSVFDVVPIDQAIAQQAAEYFRTFRKKGITLSLADALIAASTRSRGCILVTQNTTHFPMTDFQKRSL